MISIVFYILAAVTLGTGVLTVVSRNPIHSAVYMIICFFSVSGHLVMLDAQFLAMINLIVYAGAIVVLLLFTLMLMNLSEAHEPKKLLMSKLAAVIASCLMLLLILAVFVKSAPIVESYKAADIDFQSVNVIGEVLLNDYLVPFEFTSVLLTVAMVGAVLISKKREKSE